MSTTVISDPMVVPTPETQPTAPKMAVVQIEIEFAKCECCGLSEECTPAYIEKVRERNNGKWICGLCSEAVKDEVLRSGRLISNEEALDMHMNFCNMVRSPAPRPDPTKLLISAMRHVLRRSLDSPRMTRSTPSSPTSSDGKPSHVLTRSGSCYPTLEEGEQNGLRY